MFRTLCHFLFKTLCHPTAIKELKQVLKITPFVVVEKTISQVDLIYEINCNYYFWGKNVIFWDDLYFDRLIKNFVLEKKEMLYKAFEHSFHNLLRKELPGLKGELTELTSVPEIMMNFMNASNFLSYDNVSKEVKFRRIKRYTKEEKKLIEELIQLQELLKEPPFKYKRIVLGKKLLDQ